MTSVGGYLVYASSLALTVMVVVPAVWGAFVWLGRKLSGARRSVVRLFTNLSYSLVPIGMLAWIAFSFAIILPNWAYIPRVISDPFGWGWDLFGTAGVEWNPVGMRVMPILQVAALLFGLAFSIDVAWKIARQTLGDDRKASLATIPPVIFLAGVTGLFTWLLVG